MQELELAKANLDTTTGYYYVYQPTHPMATGVGCVLVHRYIAAKTLGRPLRKDEIVHHLNEVKTDNRPSNLQVMSASEHMKLHLHQGSGIKQCKPCEYCEKETTNLKFCSRECRTLASEKISISKELLQELIWDQPYTKVAELLGLSDKGVKKKAISMGCIVPPPYYHCKSAIYKDKIKKEIIQFNRSMV